MTDLAIASGVLNVILTSIILYLFLMWEPKAPKIGKEIKRLRDLHEQKYSEILKIITDLVSENVQLKKKKSKNNEKANNIFIIL